MKRNISREHYQFLKEELTHFEKNGWWPQEQTSVMLDNYEVKHSFSFIQAIMVIGSILVGVGVLSFVASNWSFLPDAFKFLLIVLSICGTYLGGRLAEMPYPRTSRSLYYIGSLLFGAGIFLVGQIFQLEGTGTAFMLWAIGIVPLVIYLKDRWVALFTLLLMGIFVGMSELSSFYQALVVLLYLGFMYRVNRGRLGKSEMLFFFTNGLAIVSFLYYFNQVGTWGRFTFIIMFVAGVVWSLSSYRNYKQTNEWQSTVLIGISGIVMSIPRAWRDIITLHTNDYVSLDDWRYYLFATISTLILIAVTLLLLRKGKLSAIPLACAIIIRFYIDLSLDFMPKSIVFLLGGFLLIGFGFWFEKSRRKAVK